MPQGQDGGIHCSPKPLADKGISDLPASQSTFPRVGFSVTWGGLSLLSGLDPPWPSPLPLPSPMAVFFGCDPFTSSTCPSLSYKSFISVTRDLLLHNHRPKFLSTVSTEPQGVYLGASKIH